MFRYENFSRKINVHREFLEDRKKSKKRTETLWKAVKIGGVVLATVAVVIVAKHHKLRLIG